MSDVDFKFGADTLRCDNSSRISLFVIFNIKVVKKPKRHTKIKPARNTNNRLIVSPIIKHTFYNLWILYNISRRSLFRFLRIVLTFNLFLEAISCDLGLRVSWLPPYRLSQAHTKKIK